jgi:LysR family transcriptional regulator, benzoate and cis,cis-muconate-responsive activator of ben and cat genes
LELRHLRYCIAVAEEGSFTRAASRLRLAQQAVSRQIADLERELGVKLFERGARGTRLTPAGVAFVEDARGAIGQTVRAALRARAQNVSGQLRLAYSYLTPPHFAEVGDAIARFHQFCPELGVDVRHLSTGDQSAALREGHIDVAFGYLMYPETGEIVDDLFRDDPVIGVILPASHPLATRGQLWLHDLGALPLLMIPREVNPEAYDGVIAALAERDLNPEIATIQAVGVPAVSMVSQGGCWKLASRTMIGEIGAGEMGAVFRPFADPPLPLGLWIRRLRRSASPLAQQFADHCCERHNGHHLPVAG